MEASVSENEKILQFTDLPTNVIHIILRKLKYREIARLRLVSKHFNGVCSFLLDAEFNNLRTAVLQRQQSIKALMPRRYSSRKKHPLARESHVIDSLQNTLSWLNLVFERHIEKNQCCFFPGDIIDEIHTILKGLKNKPSAFCSTSELDDLTRMAIDYLKDEIVPTFLSRRFLTTNLLEDSSDIKSMSANLGTLKKKLTPNHPLVKFQEQLNRTNEKAIQNEQDIENIQCSMKLARNKITSVEKELHELLQKNRKADVSCSPVKEEVSFEVKDELVASCSDKSSQEFKTSAIQSAVTQESIENQKELPTERKSSKRVATDHEEDKLPSKRSWS